MATYFYLIYFLVDPILGGVFRRRRREADRMTEDSGVVQMNELRRIIESFPMPDCLSDLLDLRAQEHGEAVLAEFFHDDTRLTYAGLSEASKRLASSLVKIGVRKGTHVGVFMSNCDRFVVAWFAIARIGAVMVPINFRFKARELDVALVDSDVQFLFVDTDSQQVLQELDPLPPLLADGAVIAIDPEETSGFFGFDDLVEAGAADFVPPVPVVQSDLLAIQFTSGSTGRPKGCMLTHCYWLTLALVASKQRAGQHSAEIKNVLVTYPLFYMQAQIEFLLALQNGGTAFIARRPSRRQFMDWVRRYSIHYCAMNPMVYNGLPVRPDDSENELKFIAAYFHRGEVLRTLQKRFNTVGRDAFGMTEAGAVANLPTAATHMLDAGTCGLPSAFREIRICDPDGNQVPVGEAGELCVAGRGMLLGYYKRPKENRESFHDGRWLRTGDRARVDENGYVYIVGRIKEMIKRSGENVAAMEVEQVLRAVPGVREVAVVAVPDDARMEEVRAVVSLKDGHSVDDITPGVLRSHCAKLLADFKVPRYYSYVEKFPRTGSEKIDKIRLVGEGAAFGCKTYDSETSQWCEL